MTYDTINDARTIAERTGSATVDTVALVQVLGGMGEKGESPSRIELADADRLVTDKKLEGEFGVTDFT